MKEALENFVTEVLVGGRAICELSFPDDIVLLARLEKETAKHKKTAYITRPEYMEW